MSVLPKTTVKIKINCLFYELEEKVEVINEITKKISQENKGDCSLEIEINCE